MDCPVCGERLREIERSGVMVDICPSCKGIWLDRGEIDKLIEMEAKGAPAAPVGQTGTARYEPERRDDRDHDDHDHDNKHRDDHGYDQKPVGKQRRTSLLQDLLGGFGQE